MVNTVKNKPDKHATQNCVLWLDANYSQVCGKNNKMVLFIVKILSCKREVWRICTQGIKFKLQNSSKKVLLFLII